ncbi:hypothetical protein KPL47_05835 [Clostridium estertheticum]|uniref:JAB domain-containing protein n=1 Tax=Clostridium estertheticum TaxID=238834 RepID=UPI001C0DB9AB|nr:JAB domain-containing protein [Clostridium estertheticum]MBU3175885.1 hypothetical protein [Clostridium estertheticum]
MSKNIYCVGKIKVDQTVIEVAPERLSHAKRVYVVKIQMIKESVVLYKGRKISSPTDAYNLIKGFLEDSDREQLILCALDTKNQPTTINVVSLGTLNSSLVHPREVFKAAILANSASIILEHNHPPCDL